MGRAPCCDKANVKKGPWSPEEDRKLKDYIDNHGTGGNWISLPHKAGLKRCGKSCRLRWLNYLRPNLKHGDFSDDEDRIICNLFATIGSRWSIIAAQLPGRTDNDIKNYWNTKLKKKILSFPPKHKSLRSMQIHLPQKQTLEPHSHPFFFSSFDTNTISRSHNLEGDPMISSLLFNPSNDISNVLSSSSIIQECPNGSNMLAFGKDQNCSSLELNHGKGINFDLSQINAGEQLGFENYLFGGLEETQKLFLYEAPPLLEFNNNGVAMSNYEDMKPLLGCNFTYTANGDASNASSKAPTSQEKLLF